MTIAVGSRHAHTRQASATDFKDRAPAGRARLVAGATGPRVSSRETGFSSKACPPRIAHSHPSEPAWYRRLPGTSPWFQNSGPSWPEAEASRPTGRPRPALVAPVRRSQPRAMQPGPTAGPTCGCELRPHVLPSERRRERAGSLQVATGVPRGTSARALPLAFLMRRSNGLVPAMRWDPRSL